MIRKMQHVFSSEALQLSVLRFVEALGEMFSRRDVKLCKMTHSYEE